MPEVTDNITSDGKPLLANPATCVIRVDNNQIKHDISSVRLEQYVEGHHVLTARLRQVGKATASSDFDDPSTYTGYLGKSISLNIKPSGGVVDSSKELEFIGVVTVVSLENSIDGINTVLITANSPTIALDGSRRNAFYYDQTAGDIIGSILRKHPITLGNLEATKGTFKFVVQHRESDYDFIMRLAGMSGKFAYYDGKEFCLTKASGSSIEELIWRETLGSFSLGLGTMAMDFESQVYNYEQKKSYKQDTKALAPQSALSSISKIAPDASQNIFKKPGFSRSPRVIADAQSLDDLLLAEKNHALGNMIVCTGQSIIPKVRAGHCVKVKGMDKLDGSYWVNAVTHNFDESGKYSNTFLCTPLDMAFPDNKYKLPPFTELQSAVVTDNNDPEKMGRIKVKVFWNDADEVPWVRYLTAHAGKDRGWFSLPEVGDEVLIGFEHGNPDLPVALGSFHNKDDAPHADTNNPQNDVKMFLTKSGNQIYFMDEAGKEQIKIAMKDGKNSILMELSGPKITIESQNGDITIKGKSISLESDQNIEIKAGADFKVDAMGSMKSKAGAMLNIEGATVTVKGTPIQLN